MKRFLILLPAFLLLTSPHAQQAKGRMGFVTVQQLVAAIPGNANYLALSKKADADLRKQQQNVQALMQKASSSPTDANRAAVSKAQQAFVNSQKTYQAQMATAFKPLAGKLDGAIAKTAKANGFSVVLEKQVAGRTKLVVYANASTDLTAAVLKELKK